ncbi:MAG: hypothetical protein Q8N04_13985 [Nitrospira sp.]|nr:hypothetical protein [Nitrospira sp.]
MALVITKELIAQHNLTDDEFKKIVEIPGLDPSLIRIGVKV